jgi:hypothetical protein
MRVNNATCFLGCELINGDVLVLLGALGHCVGGCNRCQIRICW